MNKPKRERSVQPGILPPRSEQNKTCHSAAMKDIYIGSYAPTEQDMDAKAIESWLEKASAELAVGLQSTEMSLEDPKTQALTYNS